jgi:putative endonuclease
LKLAEGFTKRYDVARLVYFECFDEIEQAIHRESGSKSGAAPGKFR